MFNPDLFFIFRIVKLMQMYVHFLSVPLVLILVIADISDGSDTSIYWALWCHVIFKQMKKSEYISRGLIAKRVYYMLCCAFLFCVLIDVFFGDNYYEMYDVYNLTLYVQGSTLHVIIWRL